MPQLTASHTFEITLDLTGTLQPAEPDVGITSADVIDVDVEDARIETVRYCSTTKRMISDSKASIFEGVDMANPEVQKIITNICASEQSSIRLALLDNQD